MRTMLMHKISKQICQLQGWQSKSVCIEGLREEEE